MIKISLIIPVYNVEKYLAEALTSVCQQTLPDIEIICIDDGSTDTSPQILAAFAAKDRRIQIITKANSGYGHSVNLGLDKARGQYVTVIEPDDYLLPDYCAMLYAAAEASGAQIVRADYCRFYDKDGQRITKQLPVTFPELYNIICNPQTLDRRIFNSTVMTWSGIIQRCLLEQHSIRHHESPGAAYQDSGFWFQLFCYADSVFYLPKTGYMYRVDNPNSSINDRTRIARLQEEYVYIYSLLKTNPTLHKFLGIYWLKKYENSLLILKRLALADQPAYLKHFQAEIKSAIVKGELNSQLFLPEEWQDIKQLQTNPQQYLERIRASVLDYDYDERIAYPAISVILRTGQNLSHLKRCLTSLATQEYCNFELLLVADTNEPAIIDLCQLYAADDRVTLIISPQPLSLPDLISRTNGTYITFFAASDYLEPSCLRHLLSVALHEKAELVGGGYQFITDQPSPQAPPDAPPLKLTGRLEDRIKFELQRSAWGVLWGKLYKRTLLDKIWWHLLTGVPAFDQRLLALNAALLADGYMILQQTIYRRQPQPTPLTTTQIPAGITLIWHLAEQFTPNLIENWGQYFLGQYWQDTLAPKYQQTTLAKTNDLNKTTYHQFLKEML